MSLSSEFIYDKCDKIGMCLGFIRVCLVFHQVFVKRYMEVCGVLWSFLGTGYTLLLNSNKKLVKVCIFFATKVWDLNTN